MKRHRGSRLTAAISAIIVLLLLASGWYPLLAALGPPGAPTAAPAAATEETAQEAPDHFDVKAVRSPQAAGVPFRVVITAKDAAGKTVHSFSGKVALADITGSLEPSETADFRYGSCACEVIVRTPHPACVITASREGASGASTPFQVVSLPPDFAGSGEEADPGQASPDTSITYTVK
ncbi:MAG: hypothetical protein AB1384_14600, partial [Actinomycetota bacterium]